MTRHQGWYSVGHRLPYLSKYFIYIYFDHFTNNLPVKGVNFSLKVGLE